MPDRLSYNTLFIILLGGGIFASSAFFISPEISTKYHFVVLLALAGGVWALCRKMCAPAPIRIGKTLYWAFFFIAFICIRAVCSDNFSARAILPFVCGWLLFFIRYQQPGNTFVTTKRISVAVGLIAVGQVLYGLYPLLRYGIQDGSFPVIKGSFDNPAGFAACLAFLLPFCFLNVRFSARVWRVLWIVSCFLILAGMILSQSRAGLLAVGCIAILYGKRYYPSLKIWSKRYSWLFVFIISLIAVGLYTIRPDSANGRLLIWRCSFSLVQDHPLIGLGPNGFQGNYMLAQASYFQENSNHKWAILADNVLHPFNEWLALVTNYGIITLLLLAFVIYYALYTKGKPLSEEKKTAILILAGIAVFGCFSYPFRYAFTWILAAWCLAVLAQDEKTLFNIAGVSRIILLGLFTLMTLFCLRWELNLLKAEHRWHQVAESPRYYQQEGKEYADIYRALKCHPQFLFSYGAELYQRGYIEESISILQICAKGLNDVDTQLLLSMNYIALEQWDSAESSLWLASRMCPNRFAPLVGLMRVYAASNRMEEAKAMAKTITSKQIKAASPQVLLFIDEARRFLEIY